VTLLLGLDDAGMSCVWAVGDAGKRLNKRQNGPVVKRVTRTSTCLVLVVLGEAQEWRIG
jgi:hypothetical protein